MIRDLRSKQARSDELTLEPAAANDFEKDMVQECRVLDFGENNGRCYYTMDYVQAKSLADLVRPGQPVEPVRAFRLILQVARALEAAHRQGVCHRDIKPSNILVTANDQALVIDFGLARRDSDPLLIRGRLGSGPYMSPEQVRGQPADFPCDIYSLGVTLYQLLTGHVPFRFPGTSTTD